MRRTVLVIAVGLACLASGAHAGGMSRKQKQIERALWTAEYYLLRENDLPAAAREYQRVLAMDPKHVAAGLMLAELHGRQGKPKKAVAVLESLAKRAGKDPSVWRSLGRARAQLGDSPAAVAAYRKALALDPSDAEALTLVFEEVERRYRGGDRSLAAEVVAAARAVVERFRSQGGAPFHRAERAVVELSGEPIELVMYDARQAYDEAFSETAWGSINQHMARAREGWQDCLAKQPDNEQCHYGLALVHSSVKASEHYDQKQAIAHFRKAPNLPDAHVQLARMHRLADELGGARKELEAAIALSPDHQRAYLELGIVEKLDGHDAAAEKAFLRAIQADAWSAGAQSAVDELAKLDPNHPVVKERLAYGALSGDVFSSNRFTAAVEMVEQAYGGVEANAKEQAALDRILARLMDNADVDSSFSMKVLVLNSEIVNAMALPNGNIYFTRGLLDFVARTWPERKLDSDSDVIGHVMGHEMAHVLRRHTLQSALFQEAIKDSQRALDGVVLTHVTRLQEIEADRVGIVLAFLAGYHPRGGIEFMEKSGVAGEIPPDLDHPTYQERAQYLEDYWSNDVRFAFQSFSFGVEAEKRGEKLEGSDAAKAAVEYKQAVEYFERFRSTVKATKRVLNNLGVVNAKLGLLAMADRDTPLHRWQTRLSIERDSAMKYVAVVREAESASTTRGGKKSGSFPRELKRAVGLFEEALDKDPSYARARFNLAALELAMGEVEKAEEQLAAIRKGARGVAWGDVRVLRGILLAERSKWEDAGKEFAAAAKLNGSSQAARFDQARLLDVSGKRADAIAAYKAYVASYPDGSWAQAAKARIKALR